MDLVPHQFGEAVRRCLRGFWKNSCQGQAPGGKGRQREVVLPHELWLGQGSWVPLRAGPGRAATGFPSQSSGSPEGGDINVIRKPASHPALGWGSGLGAPACSSMVTWAECGHRDRSERPKWGLSSPQARLPAPLHTQGPTSPFRGHQAPRSSGACQGRAGGSRAGSCQCCLGEEVGILSVSVKAGVG